MSEKILCVCGVCGKSFGLRPSAVARGRGKCCSRPCSDLVNPCGNKGPNEHWEDSEGVVHIKLTQGQETLISAEDYPKVAPYRWYAHRRNVKHRDQFYASSRVKKENGRFVSMLMHVLLFEPGPGLEVDHIFGDGLDNRRGRTKNVTHRGNTQNRRHPRSSKYPGVSWNKKCQKWHAQIEVSGKDQHLGYFVKEYDAYLAYRNKCIEIGVGCPDLLEEMAA